METIVKTCKRHGQITGADLKPAKDGLKTYWRCRLCFREKDRESWLRNKEVRLKAAREYKVKNKDLVLAQQKKYEATQRINMSDRYMKKLIDSKELTYKDLDILPELLELKRAILSHKREVKLENGHKKHSGLKTTCDSNPKQTTEQKN